MKFPDRVTVLFKLLEPPRHDSDHLKFEAWVLSEQHRRIAARIVEDVSVYDYRTAKRSTLKPFMVDKLQMTYELQVKNGIEAQTEARAIFAAVEEIDNV